jgi:LmbE family N-acetylglucosaminyl deacetylase
MAKVLAIAPHPDDETLGCGGTLMRHCAEGDEVHWLIGTGMHAAGGFSESRIREREAEIQRVGEAYGFRSVSQLGFPAARLDGIEMADLVSAIATVLKCVQPEIVYLPFHGDAHSDHRRLFEAATAACKWFRAPSVRRILAYETPSETNFAQPGASFNPTVYRDIEAFLDAKIRVMGIYRSELGEPPHPRSIDGLRALALLRGSEAGCLAAEAFVLIKQID